MMVFNAIMTLFRNYIVFVIILFITTSGFIAGYLLNEYSNDTQDLKEEANDLFSQAEAIFSVYSGMVNFETTQLNMVREFLSTVRLKILEIHLRQELSGNGTEPYSLGDYLVDKRQVVELLKIASTETAYTSGYIISWYFENDIADTFDIGADGYNYSVKKSSYEREVNEGKSIVNETAISVYLDSMYSNWNETIKNEIEEDYKSEMSREIARNSHLQTVHMSNSTFVEYMIGGEQILYFDLLKEDHKSTSIAAREKNTEASNKENEADLIATIVPLTTITTILATYIGTRLENKENDKKLSQLRADINNDPSLVEEPRDPLGFLTLIFALLLSIGGILFLVL